MGKEKPNTMDTTDHWMSADECADYFGLRRA